MKKILTLPLIMALGMLWGCGGSDTDAAEFDRSSLNTQCDYLMTQYHNNDQLLQCSLVLEPCSDFELSRLIQKWSCDLDEPTQQACYLDEDGNTLDYSPDVSEACLEATTEILPEANLNMTYLWNSLWECDGKLCGTNWCGPGDDADEVKAVTSTVDASCRRHDHGKGYAKQLLVLPMAMCRVDADIVNGANNAKQDGDISAEDFSGAVESINDVFGKGTPWKCRHYRTKECCRSWWGWSDCEPCGVELTWEWKEGKNDYMDGGTYFGNSSAISTGYEDDCTHNNKDLDCD